jgi:two-component sensor histidine kinase
MVVAMQSSVEPTAFQRQVAGRFGLVPNFFISAPDAPEIVDRLWNFAVSAYFENPIPSLFKERLFVYLSRFCEIRYCIVRHCAFLVGHGHAAGDPTAPTQTIAQAIRLLSAPTPWERGTGTVMAGLTSLPTGLDWPAPESEAEDWLFSAATLVFVEPRRSDRMRAALRHVLGGQRYEHLLGLLAFIRTAHYWTVLHPDLAYEADAQDLLKANEELTRRLLQDPEASRCDMGQRLFAELEDLRGLHERRELEQAKRALEAQVAQKELLLKDVNHRIKNSLQIVSSILSLQGAHSGSREVAAAIKSAGARVLAIAAVHERLYMVDDIQSLPLSEFLTNLCGDIGRALGCEDGIELDLAPADMPTDLAIPFALIANELITNAIKNGERPCRVALAVHPDGHLIMSVTDAGKGPAAKDGHNGTGSGVGSGIGSGLGSRIIQAVAGQLAAKIETSCGPGGYTVEVNVPIRAASNHAGPDRGG